MSEQNTPTQPTEAATNTSTADSAPSFTDAVAEGGAFAQSLSEDLRDHKAFQNVKDVNDLANQFLNSQSLIGKKFSEPETNDNGEQDAFWNKLGRPETFEGYDFDAPEELKKAGYNIEEAKQIFHEAGLTKKQAQKAFEKHSASVLAEIQKQNEAKVKNDKEFIEEGTKAFGGQDAFNTAKAEALEFLTQNVPLAVRREFADLDNKSVLTIVASVKAALDSVNKEDQPLGSSPQTDSYINLSAQELKEEMQTVYSDPDFRSRGSKGDALQAKFRKLSELHSKAVQA